MQVIDGAVLLSPTDLTKHLACAHLTTLDLAAAEGRIAAPAAVDDALALVFARGLAHETGYLDRLRGEGRSITEIDVDFNGDGRHAAEERTLDAMRRGVDVIYQAAFFDGQWGGQADFLLRVDVPSLLGAWSYEVADTKLARRLAAPALLQMAVYADRLAQLQGVAPQHVYVVTGDGVSRPFRLIDVAAYARRARAGLRTFVDRRPPTEPVPVPHCSRCRWNTTCTDQWQRGDDLSLVAFLRGDQRALLRAHGVTTVAALAAHNADDLPPSIGRSARERLVQQAAEQLRERNSGTPSYLLLPPEPHTGLLRLPTPSDGDIYLDFEGDPFVDNGTGREYLAGVGDTRGTYTATWAHDRDDERRLTAQLVDQLLARWREHPDMHVYHYAPYEPTALKRLTVRHGIREAELDQLLRGQRFVDLYAVVRQAMRLSKSSYSIKKVEAYYWGHERVADAGVSDALGSVVAYERWLVDRDAQTLADIASYNEVDVRSVRALHLWLEERRCELEARHEPQARPALPDTVPDAPVSDAERAELDLAERLRPDLPLLADLMLWHRREARPEWWDFFRIGGLDDDQLVDDSTALGPLSAPECVGTDKRSRLWRYTFEPQDTRVRADADAFDDRTDQRVGTVTELDAVGGCIVVKHAGEPKRPRAFKPAGPIGDGVLREAIAAAGNAALAGTPTLALALLDRRVPPATRLDTGETPADAVLRVGHRLDGTVLAVQGPPGSGKTTLGARLIRDLLDAGRTVGVTATSHAVIGKLLNTVDRPAVQKCEPHQHCGSDLVQGAATNGAVVTALRNGTRLVGGTAWLWARDDMASAVDVLVVDEAGQLSLANAVAVARGARSMVLLGDPQQLAQPSRAQHTPGAGASVLEHFLDGHDTIPADRGVFLDTSHRMHPAISAFVSDLAYDGRLHSAAGLEQQTILRGGTVSGSGLRVVPVHHTGNAAKSVEEARAIRDLWQSLQGVHYINRESTPRVLGPDDILVVAPYNNQVAEIRRLLPDARVGTVDKFQGQEAPVVVYSMTSSSAHDAPRGIEFLYDLHRLNVAISRAQALAVVVMNPALLDAPVHTPEQLRRVNALCRLVEEAERLTS